MQMDKNSGAYQKFLNLCNAIDALSDFPKLTPDEKCVIKILNSYWVKNEPITVVEAMTAVDTQSTSTVFRNLKKLRQKGYLQLAIDETDNRVKYVQPTNLTIKYFQEHGKALLKTAKAYN
jgi:DNA-binding MarR family transcriptional regulator